MGTRDNYETVTRVMQAFVAQRTWPQAELARHVDVQPQALRNHAQRWFRSDNIQQVRLERAETRKDVPKPTSMRFSLAALMATMTALMSRYAFKCVFPNAPGSEVICFPAWPSNKTPTVTASRSLPTARH